MLFNSYTFLFLFLPVVVVGYAYASRRGLQAATWWLILVSVVFYGWWDARYLPLLMGSALFNYLLGVKMSRRPSRLLLTFGVGVDLALLGWFKYAGFFSSNIAQLTGLDGIVVSVVLPIGISFFTFQKIAYLVDCHQGKTKQYGFLDFLLFVMFFPQLIAGPIVHHHEFLSQHAKRRPGLRQDDFAVGLTIFIMGLFKKIVLAETMAGYASPMFDAAATGYHVTFLEAWAGALAYTLQLYFDFSGYSDMAIGLGRIFGIRFPVNFASPYKATSIIDFWRRWHITLSRFLRTYLYLPLGGNRRGEGRRYVNLLLVMLLGGFWHGANWTFLAWGGLHGVFLVVNHGWSSLSARLGLATGTPPWRLAGWLLTFVSVMVAWVFFRSANLATAFNVLAGMVGQGGDRVQVNISYLPLFKLLEPLLGPPLLVDKMLPYFSGSKQLMTTGAVLALALLAPNTQQILRRFSPTYEPVAAPSGLAARLVWSPNLVWALAVVAMGVVSVIMAMQPVEFIYWQF